MIELNTDFACPVRPMGKLSGTNNGPLCTYSDETENFKKMGVDFVRFHATRSHNAKCIEVPYIFPILMPMKAIPKLLFYIHRSLSERNCKYR